MTEVSCTIKGQQVDEWLAIRRALAPMAVKLSPGYSACKHCGMPWPVVTNHSTPYTQGRACFPLCDMCWTMLLPEERLPYYEQLVKEWHQWDKYARDDRWLAIKEAVLDGK